MQGFCFGSKIAGSKLTQAESFLDCSFWDKELNSRIATTKNKDPIFVVFYNKSLVNFYRRLLSFCFDDSNIIVNCIYSVELLTTLFFRVVLIVRSSLAYSGSKEPRTFFNQNFFQVDNWCCRNKLFFRRGYHANEERQDEPRYEAGKKDADCESVFENLSA